MPTSTLGPGSTSAVPQCRHRLSLMPLCRFGHCAVSLREFIFPPQISAVPSVDLQTNADFNMGANFDFSSFSIPMQSMPGADMQVGCRSEMTLEIFTFFSRFPLGPASTSTSVRNISLSSRQQTVPASLRIRTRLTQGRTPPRTSRLIWFHPHTLNTIP